MIKVNRGEVHLEGVVVTLLAELSCAIRGVNEMCAKEIGAEAAKEVVMMAVETAFEQTHKEETRREKINELLDSLFEEIFGGK